MEKIYFSQCGKPLKPSDLDRLENTLSYRFPPTFREHYLAFNGGVPSKAYWVSDTGDEPMEVAAFREVAGESVSTKGDVLASYNSLVERSVLPEHLLPFANDWGGNLFCLNMSNGQVTFYALDSFDPDLGFEENQRHAETTLCSSFGEFAAGLVSEDDIEE